MNEVVHGTSPKGISIFTLESPRLIVASKNYTCGTFTPKKKKIQTQKLAVSKVYPIKVFEAAGDLWQAACQNWKLHVRNGTNTQYEPNMDDKMLVYSYQFSFE